MASPRIGTTVRVPRSRGRRGDPFVVVVPERPSLTRQALTGLALIAWDHRRAFAPIPLALLALGLSALVHSVAWWSGLVLAPVAAAPLVWLWIVQHRHPEGGSALAWRIALSVTSTLAVGWAAAASLFGPFAGPLELLWLLALIGTQTAWPIVRRTR